MKILGALLLAAGSVALWVLGRNYGLCHQWWIDPGQAACRQADTFHAWGIWLMILGAVSLGGGLLARVERAERTAADRANIG